MYAKESRISQSAPSAAATQATAQAAVATLVAELERALLQRLGTTGVAAGSPAAAAASSASDAAPPSQGEGVQMLEAQPAAIQSVPPAPAFSDALLRLVRLRLNRELRADEADAVAAAIDEALSVLQAGDAAARSRLLAADLADALTVRGGAWLWAVAVEASASGATTASAIAAAITDGASAVAAMLFARAAMVFGTPAMAAGDTGPCIEKRSSGRPSPMHQHKAGEY